jgi:hypothetical protein
MPFSVINRILKSSGFQVVRNNFVTRKDALYYQHDYGLNGYDAYEKIQVKTNKTKLHNVWAENLTLSAIAEYIETHIPEIGHAVCHGARNGWEVQWLKNRLDCSIIGTDISETANDMEDMVQHDFHKVRKDWLGKFSFVYTNSLDQAFAPDQALSAWADQITDDGLIFIEHTMHHGVAGASAMDPFGAHPMIMPYLFFEWGRGKYELADIIKLSDVKMSEKGVFADKGDVWVFVLAKWNSR